MSGYSVEDFDDVFARAFGRPSAREEQERNRLVEAGMTPAGASTLQWWLDMVSEDADGRDDVIETQVNARSVQSGTGDYVVRPKVRAVLALTRPAVQGRSGSSSGALSLPEAREEAIEARMLEGATTRWHAEHYVRGMEESLERTAVREAKGVDYIAAQLVEGAKRMRARAGGVVSGATRTDLVETAPSSQDGEGGPSVEDFDAVFDYRSRTSTVSSDVVESEDPWADIDGHLGLAKGDDR